MFMLRSLALTGALIAIIAGHAAAQQTRVTDVPLQGGISERVLSIRTAHPRAALVMLPGGGGKIGIGADGAIRQPDNFLVRTRDVWASHGFAVFVVDALNNEDLRGQRRSARYAAAVDAVAALASEQTHAPVFLVGTSQGSIAAMNGASHAAAGAIAGVILTESVSEHSASGETVFDAAPAGVRVPALVLANRDDRCNAAPPSDAPRIAAAMRNSPDARVEMVAGGETQSGGPCDALTPHGYFGVETEAENTIVEWVNRHLAQ
jgi:alpha-beta hydrolase superfamily lysophospholipase